MRDRKRRASFFVALWGEAVLSTSLLFSSQALATVPNLTKTKGTDILPIGTNESSFDEALNPNGKTTTTWNLSAGGSISTGNTQTWTFNAGTDFKFTSGSSRFTFNALTNLEGINEHPEDPNASYETTVQKVFAVARYDWFFTRLNALWTSATERWDPFSGYNTQFIASGGYLRAIIREKDNLFTARTGYAFTVNDYSSHSTASSGDSTVHGLIAALDYHNQLNQHVQFQAVAAYIININRIEAQDAGAFENSQVSVTAALTSNIFDQLKVEARFLLLYDSKPAAEFATDTTTVLSLVYSVL